MQKSRFMLATALASSTLALLAQPAWAQDVPPQAAEEESEGDKVIVVTGSRIARPTLESPVPVITVSPDDLLTSATLNIGDALNNLPALRSTFSQANSTRFIGTSGLNVLDLRGLGTARTLVLVNGRRHVTTSPGDYLVDTNTIPDDLLERVDIVTGGSSAVYGSDAVAGVVNFVLKRDFDGIRLSGQGSVSSRGDRGSYFGALTAGKNFAEGRGNIAVALEYSKANPLFFVQRDRQTGAFSGRSQFNLAESTVGEPAAGNGVPDNQFFRGVRSGTIADGGLVTAICNRADPAQLNDLARCRASSRGPGSGSNGIGIGQRYVFDRSGNLVLSNPSLDFRDITTNFGALNPSSGSSNTVGGLGSTLRNTGQLDPGLERYSANILARFEVSETFQPFFEGKYVRIQADQEGQPSFFQGMAQLGLPELRCNNPFLSAQALTTLQSVGRCANAASDRFAISRFNVDFGGRGERQRRETYRFVAGVEGIFNDDWKYELAFNYGRLESRLRSLNNLVLADIDGNPDGFSLAADAVLAPASFSGSNFETNSSGQKVICAINAMSNVRPDCVPINLFGFGAPSRAALNFVNTTSMRRESATQIDITANLTGDTSQFFELPGGPARFSIGAEYRSEKAASVFDPLTASGATFLNAIAPFLPPKLKVKEVFGEIEIPLLKDKPFVEELTLSGAGRISDYNTSAGTTYTYNGSVYYAPIRDIRFRAGYARAVRTPTQSDLFSPPSQNFATVADPCDVQNINNGPGGSTNRIANCAADGVPVGFVNMPARTQTLSFLDSGNPFLTSETADSYTVGVVVTPDQIPGLSLTVDYYDIKVKNLIAGVGIQTIINQCYDAPTLNNSFCPLVNPRNADGTFATPFIGLASSVNFAKQTTSGIDAEIAYTRTLGSGDRISINSILSYVIDRTNFIDPVDPTTPTRQLSNLGDPQFEGQLNATYLTAGGFSFRYELQYIGKQSIGLFAAQRPFNGSPPTNADQFPRKNYKAFTYHNLRAGFLVDKKFEFYAGVDNLFDKLPPLGLLGNEAGGAIFSNVGRQFYAGFKANF